MFTFLQYWLVINYTIYRGASRHHPSTRSHSETSAPPQLPERHDQVSINNLLLFLTSIYRKRDKITKAFLHKSLEYSPDTRQIR